jgi:predicted nucleotidyltransferase
MSTSLEAALLRVQADLNDARARWALIGGFAISARTEPRFTRDIDIAVAVADDSAAESLVRTFLANGYGLLASLEQDAKGRLATVRLVSPVDSDVGVVVDLLFASSGIETEIAEDAEEVEVLPDVIMPVATTGHLIALKLLSQDAKTRPRDAEDLIRLREVAGAGDIELAIRSVHLITTRGFGRDRDLLSALDEFGLSN